MKHPFIFTLLLLAAVPGVADAEEEAIDPDRAANLIILDETGVKNLGIQTVEAEEIEFETTVFAIGRIEEIPTRRSVLSSRISGRAIRVHASEGDQVEEGALLVEVESRQPGNPPPIISLNASQSGLIVESHVRVGQPVEPAEELLDISNRSEVWAVAKIPEKEAASVVIGTPARIQIPALGEETIEATLSRYGVAADRQAGTVEGIFQISNPDGKLVPGMRAEFSLIIASRSGVVAVPRRSIQGDPSSRVVYVKDFDLKNVFVRTPVHVGEQNDQFVEITSGLFPADEVVTDGAYSLGFAGGGSGISLKEALDAAHGHEHNEDGSELSPEQATAKEADHDDHDNDHDHADGGKLNTYLAVYAIIVTLLFLGLA
ncbi:MAG: efflux RND transporter periplasmic adaptor subunit, partial [Verrucomicrobia bacterium]|nr:efflux RND transporter periplasmic adaptor subunit [Verrucomicrobiota bacterium]